MGQSIPAAPPDKQCGNDALRLNSPPSNLLAREPGPLCQSLEFFPDDLGMDLGPVTGLRGEAAIGAGDDVFSSDDLGIANKSLGNEFRMLDDVAGVRDDARDQTLAGRQPNRLPYMVLVFVSRVRTFEGVESSLDLQHVANDVLQFGVE